MRLLLSIMVCAAILVAGSYAHAEDVVEMQLVLKDHVFAPRELDVPQAKKIKVTLKNEDASAAEFESAELHREKVVAANGTITFYVGPLDAGSYPFFDDFHRETTTGTIVAK